MGYLQRNAGKSKNVIIIAEAGVNHMGQIDKALELIDVAADSGADYVKFQTFRTEKIVTRYAKKAEYQSKNLIHIDDSQYHMLKQLELDDDAHFQLKDYCNLKGIQFLSTAFDEESVDFLYRMDIPFYKIPSGEITNKPYLQHIAKKRKPVILSTGMAKLREIEQAIAVLTHEKITKELITVLHCNTQYPTPMCDVNLLAMLTIKNALKVNVGYSDHTLGIEVPIAAVALGAKIIEKHFTLDRSLPGPDHRASLEPNELKDMVISIRNIELAVSGNGKKEPSMSELSNILAARRSIHYAKALNKGHIILPEDLIMKRPGSGISPMLYETFVGKIIAHDVNKDQILSREDLR